MNPKKFVAATTRAALAKVRETLGDDAVILSNRSTPHGVEVCALAEQDFESLVGTVQADAVPPQPTRSVPASKPKVADGNVAATAMRSLDADADTPAVAQPVRASRSPAAAPGTAAYTPAYWSGEPEAPKPFRFIDYVRNKLATKAAPQAAAGAADKSAPTALTESPASAEVAESAVQSTATFMASSRSTASTSAPGSSGPARSASTNAPAATVSTTPVKASGTVSPPRSNPGPIVDEIKALRHFVAERFDLLAAGAESGLQLIAAMLRRDLLNAGFQPMIVRAVLESLPAELGAAQARDWVEARLARSLSCASAAEDIIDTGGVFALTGATGVGKTTTAAKLAARCAVRYGADSVGLITTDTYRIGAPDQLRIYGKILGVPVHTVHDPDWLQRTLETLADKRLVLIDTIGMSQRDGRVNASLEMLDSCNVKRLLLLAASSQPETQEEVIELYGGRTGAGAILTKVDETVKLAPAVSVLLRYRLKLRYVTNGQRVPEDLYLSDATKLVHLAMRPQSRVAPADETLERRRDAAAGR